jgi:hypothetical protein
MNSLQKMIRKPKSIYCHYKDSLIINSTNLKSFLISHSVSLLESKNIVDLLSYYYNQKVELIMKACDNEWAKLESFTSPLILFIFCISKVINSTQITLSKKSRTILQSFLISLECWMIW